MKISSRLTTVASFIKDNSFVMDVGADHGLLELYLSDNKHLKGLIAVENKKGPYAILKKAVEGRDVICLFSDGISEIDEKVDTLVIAGMGGNLIVDILTKNVNKLEYVKNIVVDAHIDNELVRREIVKLGYKIEQEKIVYENKKYYFVISFVKGTANYTDSEYEIGINLVKDPLFNQYRITKLATLKSNLEKAKTASKINKNKIIDFEGKIRRLESYGNN